MLSCYYIFCFLCEQNAPKIVPNGFQGNLLQITSKNYLRMSETRLFSLKNFKIKTEKHIILRKSEN